MPIISTESLDENAVIYCNCVSAVSLILVVVGGTDVATKEGSEDDISLYPAGRHCCDAVTE